MNSSRDIIETQSEHEIYLNPFETQSELNAYLNPFETQLELDAYLNPLETQLGRCHQKSCQRFFEWRRRLSLSHFFTSSSERPTAKALIISRLAYTRNSQIWMEDVLVALQQMPSCREK